jgi:hypothetical protein
VGACTSLQRARSLSLFSASTTLAPWWSTLCHANESIHPSWQLTMPLLNDAEAPSSSVHRFKAPKPKG